LNRIDSNQDNNFSLIKNNIDDNLQINKNSNQALNDQNLKLGNGNNHVYLNNLNPNNNFNARGDNNIQ